MHVIVHVHVFIPQQATTWQGAGIKILRGSTALYADAGYGVGHYTDSANNRFMKNIEKICVQLVKYRCFRPWEYFC